MRSAVDQPGGIEHHSVSEQAGDEVSHSQRFTPEVPGHQRGHEEAKDQHREFVVPEMKEQTVSHTDPVTPGHKPVWGWIK